MKTKTEIRIEALGVIVGVLLAVFLIMYFLQGPEYIPNQEYVDEVLEWSGQRVSCDSEWLIVCEEYKKAHKVTFDCFEES